MIGVGKRLGGHHTPWHVQTVVLDGRRSVTECTRWAAVVCVMNDGWRREKLARERKARRGAWL